MLSQLLRRRRKPEDVKAKYESGVLTVLIPKEEPKKLNSSSKIAIE